MRLLAALQSDISGYLFLFVLVAILGIVFYYQKWRRDQLRRVAEEMGFTFDARAEQVGLEGWQGLPLLLRASKVSNALWGQWNGVETILLDCKVGRGKYAYRQTLACFRLAGAAFPAFELKPETLMQKLGSALGYQDIDFEAYPEFSQTYVLRGLEEAALRRLFSAAVLRFFEHERGWWVEGTADWLTVYRERRRVGPGKIRSFAEETWKVSQVFARQDW